MPPRPSRPCAHTPHTHGDPHRCPNLTRHRSGLCERHLAAQRAHTDANRPTAHRRGYDTAHRTDAAAAKQRGQACQHPGCTRTDIHRDHHDGNPRNNQADNIRWLCSSHHSRKTLTQDVDRDDHGRILRADRSATKPQRPTIRNVEL